MNLRPVTLKNIFGIYLILVASYSTEAQVNISTNSITICEGVNLKLNISGLPAAGSEIALTFADVSTATNYTVTEAINGVNHSFSTSFAPTTSSTSIHLVSAIEDPSGSANMLTIDNSPVPLNVLPKPPALSGLTASQCSQVSMGINLPSTADVAFWEFQFPTFNPGVLSVHDGVEGGNWPKIKSHADGLTFLADDEFNNFSKASRNLTYKITAIATNTCRGDEFSIPTVIHAQPVGTTTTDITCSGDNWNQPIGSLIINFPQEVSNEGVEWTISQASNPNMENEFPGTFPNYGNDDIVATNVTTTTAWAQSEFYSITGRSLINGCSGTSFLKTMVVNPTPAPAISSSVPGNTIEAGESITLTASDMKSITGVTYSWDDPSTTTMAALTVSPSTTTMYTVTLNTPDGCDIQSSLEVIVNGALPVELSYFNIRPINNGVLINWETASEFDNDKFNIQHSLDGEKWETIGVVNGAGNSSVSNNYSYLDRSPHAGINYYRLQQIDFNGTFEYSKIKEANIKTDKNSITIYPNPVRDRVTIKLSKSVSNETTIQIIDAVSNTVFNKKIQGITGLIEIPVGDLAPGIYFAQVLQGEEILVQRFTKQ